MDVTFRHENIMRVFKLFYPKIKTEDLSVETVRDSLMSLRNIKIIYAKKSLLVIDRYCSSLLSEC